MLLVAPTVVLFVMFSLTDRNRIYFKGGYPQRVDKLFSRHFVNKLERPVIAHQGASEKDENSSSFCYTNSATGHPPTENPLHLCRNVSSPKLLYSCSCQAGSIA